MLVTICKNILILSVIISQPHLTENITTTAIKIKPDMSI